MRLETLKSDTNLIHSNQYNIPHYLFLLILFRGALHWELNVLFTTTLRCFIGLGLVYLMLYVIVSIIFLNRQYYIWISPLDTVIVFYQSKVADHD